jgi:hypothetical protein
MPDAKDNDNDFPFEPFEEQPEAESPGGELPEGDVPGTESPEDGLPSFGEDFEEIEGLSPDDPLGEEGLEPDAASEPGVLGEDVEDAFPAEEGFPAAAVGAAEAEGEEEEEEGPPDDGKKKSKKEKKPRAKKEKKGDGLIGALKKASPYTVMLVIAFLALVLGILCLLSELGRYEYDIKAENALRGSIPAPALYSPAPNSTLAAWPTAEKLNFSAVGGAPSSGSV